MSKKVYVGMSGGVDSSVTAALLKKQGYDVTGVYMKNWSQDLLGFICRWKEDYQDAKRVAVQLDIDFKLYDFEAQYRHKVVDYMVAEYQAGCTPNPDITCNQEVKFKLFLETALEEGADLIATGHYARIGSSESRVTSSKYNNIVHSPLATRHSPALLKGVDANKDQSYFLYRITEEALHRSLMPIGEFQKSEVRRQAKKMGLATADKKDSQGICFVGQVSIKDFLLAQLGPQLPGPIVDQTGKEIGQHDGALFYTIGQRHGLNVGGGLPYYVTKKDMKTNTVYVTTNLDDEDLWTKKVKLENLHWINDKPLLRHPEIDSGSRSPNLKARLRYRGPLVPCQLSGSKLILAEEQRGIAAGQSAVIYDGDRCLGGGIIC